MCYILERVWMVQTEQQYICIHQCLLAVLEGKENVMSPPREIHDNQGYEGESIESFLNSFVTNINFTQKGAIVDSINGEFG